MGKKARSQFLCSQCGAVSVRWLGRCAECGEFGTMQETEVVSSPSGGAATSRAAPLTLGEGHAVAARCSSGIGELDRVLGGGLVPGSVILVGGEPGAGKSTLLLQASDRMSRAGRTVLLVSGEESPAQVEMRARRLGCAAGSIFLLCETSLDCVTAEAEKTAPDFLVIDSIQTLYAEDVEASPGSVSQVKECSLRLQRLAKERGIATCLVGHVTKDGSIAGPRIIEHLVDTVLYFEGERFDSFRVLRAVKNRFGSVSEVGIFEMRDTGLAEVENPSALFLADRGTQVSGTAISVTMEGRRPLLVEVQALVTPSFLPVPKRVAAGLDFNRLAINVAVLDRRAGLKLADRDVFVSVVGGLKVLEPALDLGVCMALASSQKDRPLPDGTVYFGEVSLTGEIRPVAAIDPRLKEAAKLGFRRVLMPRCKDVQGVPGLDIVPVSLLRDAIASEL